MKAFLIFTFSLIALPLFAGVRAGARAGVFAGAGDDLAATFELDLRGGQWSVSPAYEVIRGGYDLHATHVDVRRYFALGTHELWIGAGPTFVNSNAPSSDTTWNVDAGFAWHRANAWQPFIAARYYTFRMPVFRDVIEGNGAVISIGISRRLR